VPSSKGLGGWLAGSDSQTYVEKNGKGGEKKGSTSGFSGWGLGDGPEVNRFRLAEVQDALRTRQGGGRRKTKKKKVNQNLGANHSLIEAVSATSGLGKEQGDRGKSKEAGILLRNSPA